MKVLDVVKQAEMKSGQDKYSPGVEACWGCFSVSVYSWRGGTSLNGQLCSLEMLLDQALTLEL